MTDMTSEQAAQRIFLLKMNIKDFEAEVKSLTEQFFSSRDLDTYVEGAFQVKVERNARFDAATAKANLTPEQFESILSLSPDSKKAKDVLAPADYRLAQKEFDPKVSVLLPKEEN